MHIYIYTHIYICIYTHTHIYIYIYAYMYTHIYTNIYKHPPPSFADVTLRRRHTALKLWVFSKRPLASSSATASLTCSMLHMPLVSAVASFPSSMPLASGTSLDRPSSSALSSRLRFCPPDTDPPPLAAGASVPAFSTAASSRECIVKV